MSDAFHWPDFLPAFRKAAALHGFEQEVLCSTSAGPLCAWTRDPAGGRDHNRSEGQTNQRPIYLSAGIHGDEPAGPLALLQLMN
ncbi:MAG: hypothetical protein R3242_09865, partial [Akkermansiaceae bacterium]|nr:hypothetical protein [Akkermansiaceae bacterium]